MRVSIDSEKLDLLANVISDKSGESVPMTLTEMTDAVDGILVPSGTITITENGTNIDVTRYATADVAISSGGGGVVYQDEDGYVVLDDEGGSGIIAITPLSVTANGTYTAPNGVAYSPVNVVVPTSAPTLQSKSAVPTETAQTVVSDNGYDGLSSVEIGAISSTYVGSGITRRSSSDLTASGAIVTVPSGYYASDATKTIASGTAGIPTATKGTVSNHSISVTPSVTNTTGYITGGTKTGNAVSVSASELVSGTYTVSVSGTHDVTNYASASVASGSATASATKGTVSNHSVTVTPSVTRTAGYITAGSANGTAVTVSASELVSGSQTITDNGTTDVTNLASVTVSIPFVTYYTGTSDPASSLGSNGDIYLKVVS